MYLIKQNQFKETFINLWTHIFIVIIYVITTGTIVFGHNNPEHIIEDHVDLIELNHCYNESGHFKFDQIIYWNYNRKLCQYVVVDYRMLKDVRRKPTEKEVATFMKNWRKNFKNVPQPSFVEGEFYGAGSIIPYKNGNIYTSLFIDGQYIRRVTSLAFKETWTTFDPEIDNRHILLEIADRKLLRLREN